MFRIRTPRNILQHELIGLRCRVVESKNESQSGISGRIIDETLKTLVIECVKRNGHAEGAPGIIERKRIEKKGRTFRVWLDKTAVDIQGSAILARPEDRIKKIVKRW